MLKDFPKISIVTPSFNQVQFLEAAIESVLSQNYPNLEYIVIDGGSTDGSIEMIRKYEKQLHFWCSEPDQGQYHAINKGFQYATGDIMGWLNSDDMYYPWTFKTVSSIMSELTEVEWLSTLYAGWWDWQGFSTDFTIFPGFSKEAFLDGYYMPWRSNSWIQQESTFWRKSLWQKTGGKLNTQYSLAADFDLWTEFYRHANLYGVNSALGGFRSQSGQKSSQKELYISEAINSLEKMQSSEGWSPNNYRRWLRNLKVHKIPKIKELMIPTAGYKGKRIVRKNGELPSGTWDIEDYYFF